MTCTYTYIGVAQY